MKKQIIGFCVLFLPLLTKSQLVINEVSSSCGTNILMDDNGNNQDWVEIYNPTSSPVLASNFYITNKTTSPLKWKLPNINIAPGGFMLVYCSEENRITGTFYHSNFKLDRAGDKIYIYNSSSFLIDGQTFGNLDQDHSYGRSPNGSASLVYFNTPTPGTSNNASTAYTGYCPTVTFSIARGFYASAQTLTLTCPGYQIRYTTNGSEPKITSALYSVPLNISTTQIVKARAFPFSGNILPGKITSNTYFIGETQIGNVPVVSITMDPADFNTVYNTTNYMTNYYPEKPGHIEYYKNQKKFAFETDFDLKLHGTTSTTQPQKGLRVSCRSNYNAPSIKDTLFPWDKIGVKKFDGFNLRHDNGGGSQWDPYATQLATTLNVDYLAYRPCIVFINGAYWGEYQLRESGDEDYIAGNHPGVNKDSVDLLRQNLNWANNSNTLTALAGSDTAFFNHLNTIKNTNPNTSAFYNFFRSKFDDKSYFDYFISEIYVGNTDWLGANAGIINNIKLWRSQKPNSKWRYILYDCDYSIGIQTTSTDVMPYLLSPGTLNYHGQIFKQVTLNPTLKTYFINRFADLLNTRYQPAEANPVAIAMRDSLIPIIQRHLLKWGSTTYPQWLGWWNTYWIGSAAPRLVQLRNHIQTDFAMTAQLTTTFEVYPSSAAGTILLNTIEPLSYPWSGVYFNGAPITVKSKAKTGWKFDHWESTDLGTFNTTDSNTFNLNTAQVVKLFFKVDNTGISALNGGPDDGVELYPNPVSGQLKLKMRSVDQKGVDVELFNSVGEKISNGHFSNSATEITDLSPLIENCAEGIYFIGIRSGQDHYYKKIILTTTQK